MLVFYIILLLCSHSTFVGTFILDSRGAGEEAAYLFLAML